MSKYKKILIPVLGCYVILSSFCLTWKGLRYLLVDDTTSYTRVMMHEFYNQDDISVLVMGASHCYRGIDTEVLDEKLGVNTFNAGSSNQSLTVTFSLMKEAISLYNIDHIYVDLSYNIARRSVEKRNNPTVTYLIADYMRPSFNKYKLLLDNSDPIAYANSFLVARRNYEKLFDIEYISTLLDKKSEESYTKYMPIVRENEWYVKKGYIAENTVRTDGCFFTNSKNEICSLDEIDPEWIKTVIKIIKYCKEKNVEVTFISVPVTSYRMVAYGNYDEYCTFIKKLIEPYDVEYIDFNMLKESYFDDTAMFYSDASHMNRFGAEKFSEVLGDFISGKVSKADLFYNSVEQKFESIPVKLYGVRYLENDEAGLEHVCKVITNHDGELNFRVMIDDENENQVLLRDFSTETEFIVPANYKGDLYVQIKNNDSEECTEYAIQTNFKEDM